MLLIWKLKVEYVYFIFYCCYYGIKISFESIYCCLNQKIILIGSQILYWFFKLNIFHRFSVVWLFYRLKIISLIDWWLDFLFHCISAVSIIDSYGYTNQISSVISVSSSSVIGWKIKIQTVTSIWLREQMVLWKSILTG